MQTPTSTIVQTGDLGGEKITMGIDQSALAHIMSVLTDLYSDREGAVIREYSTNARDAHIEAGNAAPIEIHTPSALSPYFKVIDYGVGLSVDDIRRIYSQYGASTKRGTDEQTGMLGLGAKSALALVPQFNIISRKDGVEIFVSVSRSADGGGRMEIVDTKGTNLPNGVEVSIPMNRSSYFMDKVKKFFKFWEPGTVLIDGAEPEPLKGEKVGSRFVVNSDLGQDYVVMGGVAYPTKDPIYRVGFSKLGIVAFVNIGDIHFTPSREALMYTPQTKALLESLAEEFKAELAVSAQKDMDVQPDYFSAWETARKWWSNFRIDGLTYKQSDITHSAIETNPFKTYTLQGGRSYGRKIYAVDPSDATRELYIINFTNADLKMSPQQRRKAKRYCINKGLNFHSAAVTQSNDVVKDPAHRKFLKGFRIVDWKDINAIVIPRETVAFSGVVRTDPYDLYVDGYTTQQISRLDASKPIIYYSPAEVERHPTWMKGAFGPDAQIIVLNKNRWDKFKRDWPTARHYLTAMHEDRDALMKQLTEADKYLWHYTAGGHLHGIDVADIDDPEVVFFLTTVRNGTLSPAGQRLKSFHSQSRYSVIVHQPENPLTRYPMYGNMYRVDKEHIIWYLNSYYNDHLKEN